MVTEPVVEVVGLGPAGPDLLTVSALEALRSGRPTFLRTVRHPSAGVAPAGAVSFDHLYDRASAIDEVYRGIVEELVARATGHGSVVYAVPGSPFVAERTVELLVADDRVRTVVHPALSFLELAWVRLGVDPVELGVRLVDGHRFATEAAGERGPLLVGQCDSAFVLSDVKLAVDDPPDRPVVLLQRLGLPEEAVVEVAWEDLDRAVVPDHLTSLWIPRLAAPVASEVAAFEELVRRLRMEDPWKAAQDHDSLRRFLLEESYEVLEAIDAYDARSGDGSAELTSELGDLLYQVVIHSVLGAEEGWFDLSDVARAIRRKLQRRHDDLLAATGGRPLDHGVDAAVAAWEASKRVEHGRDSAFDGIPHALPALTRVQKVQRTAEALGLHDVAGHDLRAEVDAVIESPDDAGRIGALLAGVAGVARAAGVDPEDALRQRIDADEARYRASER